MNYTIKMSEENTDFQPEKDIYSLDDWENWLENKDYFPHVCEE